MQYDVVLLLGYAETLKAILPPFPVTEFTPNFTGYDLDQKNIDWYDVRLKTAPNDLLAYVRNTSFIVILANVRVVEKKEQGGQGSL